MIIVPFELWDIEALNMPDAVKKEVSLANPSALQMLASYGLIKTIKTNSGQVVGIMGAVPKIPGVCEVFLFAAEEQKNNSVGFARTIKRELWTFRQKFRRIQSLSLDMPVHVRFHTFLGFEREGILKKYGMEGENMIIWGLT